MRLLVCGGESHSPEHVERWLESRIGRIEKVYGKVTHVITFIDKGAALGTSRFFVKKDVVITSFPFNALSQDANFREQRILNEGRPDVVLVFPTQWNCHGFCRLAEERGAVVKRLWEDTEYVCC